MTMPDSKAKLVSARHGQHESIGSRRDHVGATKYIQSSNEVHQIKHDLDNKENLRTVIYAT